MTRLEERTAERDPRLSARVVSARPLSFACTSEDPDRPGHVRAASGLAWWGGRLVLVQDDALWLGLLEPAGGGCESVPLPAIRGEPDKLFDEGLGNKRRKPDLESCLVTEVDGERWLVAFGSGSTPAREKLLVVRGEEARRLAWVEAPRLYARLRAAFGGPQLNLEGAALVGGGTLRLFQRGNGATKNGLVPVNGTCDLAWAPILDALRAGREPFEEPRALVRWELGALQGVRLGFTDATPAPGGAVAFLAAAEASPDAVDDGLVSGSALGVIDAAGRARWAPLEGHADPLKAEGLALEPGDPLRAWAVVDPDEPTRPAELLRLELAGPWW